VKLAPLPKKKTKKGTSVEETNAKLLYYEQLVYNSQFRTLQGKFIPNIPKLSSSKSPPVYGEADGKKKKICRLCSVSLAHRSLSILL
ncbi:MAG: hypothetical protein ACI8RD_012405, partial [Bacillariaceae sp.]|jgi:hypothetical protein